MPADTKFVAIVRNPGTWLLKSIFKTEVCIEKGRSESTYAVFRNRRL